MDGGLIQVDDVRGLQGRVGYNFEMRSHVGTWIDGLSQGLDGSRTAKENVVFLRCAAGVDEDDGANHGAAGCRPNLTQTGSRFTRSYLDLLRAARGVRSHKWSRRRIGISPHGLDGSGCSRLMKTARVHTDWHPDWLPLARVQLQTSSRRVKCAVHFLPSLNRSSHYTTATQRQKGTHEQRYSKQYRGETWDLVRDDSDSTAFTCQDCPPDRGPCFGDMADNMLLSGVAKLIHFGGSIKANPIPCLACHHHGGWHRRGFVWMKRSQAPSSQANTPPSYHPQQGHYPQPSPPGVIIKGVTRTGKGVILKEIILTGKGVMLKGVILACTLHRIDVYYPTSSFCPSGAERNPLHTPCYLTLLFCYFSYFSLWLARFSLFHYHVFDRIIPSFPDQGQGMVTALACIQPPSPGDPHN
ncbi:hypothetical protein OG21DRAFT_1527337 [Imleria badia]|nr:hypothetical protein OG21DRAFT_1527337 [Imleria badia]